MIGHQRIGFRGIEFAEGLELVFQHLKHQTRIEFWVVHMPRLEAAILIVFDEVVVGIARKGQRVQPQGVDRGGDQFRQTRAYSREMRKIMAQDVVSDQMISVG
ncbi:hypothetical protein U879_03190 [Defluviimonas sp. 20V17]|nr:hypothetical protein U879_03190 [Defluviimonas sp. 20V17]